MFINRFPIVIVPDLHGKVNFLKELLVKFRNYHFVFLGDFLDSLSDTPEDQYYCLLTALDMVKNRQANIVLANHEASYFLDRKCAGWNIVTEAMTMHLKYDYLKHVNLYLRLKIKNKDVLITHAGASSNFFGTSKEALFVNLRQMETSSFRDSRIFALGHARGGFLKCGGILWCDFFKEYENIEGVIQIFGHSSKREEGFDGIICLEDKNALGINADCLDYRRHVVILDSTSITSYDLDSGKSEKII